MMRQIDRRLSRAESRLLRSQVDQKWGLSLDALRFFIHKLASKTVGDRYSEGTVDTMMEELLEIVDRGVDAGTKEENVLLSLNLRSESLTSYLTSDAALRKYLKGRR